MGRKLKEKTCAICGKKFLSKYDRWENSVCSETCRRKIISQSKLKGQYKQCLWCGEDFWVKPSQINKRKHCNIKCLRETEKSNHRTLICQWCGKEMKVNKIADWNKKYCSVECHDKAQVKRIIVPCTICGKLIERYPSIVKRQNVFLCSKECYSKYFLERVVFFQSRTNTKPERMFNEQTPEYINQTSDGKFFINFNNGKIKNPDFIVRPVNETKKVIEIFGRYWHEPKEEQELINHYREVGYNCLVIWEEEVYDQTYSEKLEAFLSEPSAVLVGNN